ncbi:flavodoxin family protein [Paraburkholderia tropica]|uniref:Multimeric flavodoxin WrbA n=1 Tax=Paraburkholderia tropica TaxID=92647 RepID=A0ABX5MER0_9BURK|nr:flavodoxin family protein [Paraburkholderia tropica]PXX07068.1 multimeric flavodoxin WrbA [Paraburkholderia tropica]PZW72505.1 multimeric flavodoxin WrbA [Paraburkholderia tropica]
MEKHSAQRPVPEVRKGQVQQGLAREAFRARFLARYAHPAFRAEDGALDRLEEFAWEAYRQGRKSPVTQKAGPGYADPDYALSVEWREAAERGEALSRLNAEPDLHNHPCKGCVSTAMPLCHWPCSCYPNHSLGQVNDWMNDIYERFAACHGAIFITPVYWYQVSSPLKLMMGRLVCTDGGNPDPTSTHGKDPAKAKALELGGWQYPKHLAGRAYGAIVHGDVAGIEDTRRALADWLDWMGWIDAGAPARIDRMVGYYEPYATSHETLDGDVRFQEEVANVARAVISAVKALRAGHLHRADEGIEPPRPK